MPRMQVGDEDGHGRYGVLDEDADGLLCHECGHRFSHLGLHAYKAHGLTAKEYRSAHGLGRRGLVAEPTRRTLADNARQRFPVNSLFVQKRDPARAAAARLAAGSVFSPAGLEAMRRASTGQGARQRLGIVVACERCGLEFCPLKGARGLNVTADPGPLRLAEAAAGIPGLCWKTWHAPSAQSLPWRRPAALSQ